MQKKLAILRDDIRAWAQGWYFYLERKFRRWGGSFESKKDLLVDFLMARRGSYQQTFLHLSLSILLVVGVMSAPILANAYPGGVTGALAEFTPPSAVLSSLDVTQSGVQTQISDKPRDQIITYTVQKGDTLETVASKFGVSVDSIKWATDIKSESLSIGQELQIPPVTGLVIKVREGETVYTIAKKYRTDAQKIVNWPFNDFADPDTFALNVGQSLVIPDGVMPEAAPIIAYTPLTLSTGFATPLSIGNLLWPTNGIITQCPIWYHMAFDIANPAEPGIMAANDGVVAFTGFQRFGYGNHVIIDHGGGFATLYAHMTEYYVKVGDHVARGQVIGKMGTTGRSTGPHLHFETRQNNVLLNPTQFFNTSCGH